MEKGQRDFKNQNVRGCVVKVCPRNDSINKTRHANVGGDNFTEFYSLTKHYRPIMTAERERILPGWLSNIK